MIHLKMYQHTIFALLLIVPMFVHGNPLKETEIEENSTGLGKINNYY